MKPSHHPSLGLMDLSGRKTAGKRGDSVVTDITEAADSAPDVQREESVLRPYVVLIRPSHGSETQQHAQEEKIRV